MKRTIALIIPFIFILGCATGDANYVQPLRNYSSTNTIELQESKDDAWKRIVPALGKAFYVINNIDKDSGLINFSYSGDPVKYVDCGRITSTVTNLRGTRDYNFPASQAFQEYETMNGINLIHISRKMHMTGRINLIMEELSQKNVRITINTRYVLTKSITARATNGQTQSTSDTVSFNTNETGHFSSSQTVCRPTGKLEKHILSLITQ